MSDYPRKPTGYSDPTEPEPTDLDLTKCDCDCKGVEPTKPPQYTPPEKCANDPRCKCPTPPPSTPMCLETLINKQTNKITAAADAQKLKEQLQALLDLAKKAATTYTQDQYKVLVKQWHDQDALFAELVRKLVCAVKCWKCVLECYVCRLLNDLRYFEKSLYDDGQVCTVAYDLYDVQYYYTKHKAAKKRVLDRIEGILKVWQDPLTTIRAVLNNNQSLYGAASSVIGTEPGKAIYDVFLKLIPLHLAIAPRSADGSVITKIDTKYMIFCGCDDEEPVWCCCIDVGPWTLRQRLTGPQPFLIDPGRFFDFICCLVEKRYLPAKKAFNEVDFALTEVKDKIATYEKQLADALDPQNANNLEKTAKAAIPGVIDCRKYDCHDKERDYDRDKGGDDDAGDDDTPRPYRSR